MSGGVRTAAFTALVVFILLLVVIGMVALAWLMWPI